MSRKIKCPSCGNEFHLSGAGTNPADTTTECYECGKLFNPRKQSDVPERGVSQ